MSSKELKRLSRRDLVDIIYQMKKNEEKLEREIISLKAEIQEKSELPVPDTDAMAGVTESVTDVLAAMQSAAEQYLKEITNLKEETEKDCAKKIADAKETSRRILENMKKEYQLLIERYRIDYAEWEQLQNKLSVLREIDRID